MTAGLRAPDAPPSKADHQTRCTVSGSHRISLGVGVGAVARASASAVQKAPVVA